MERKKAENLHCWERMWLSMIAHMHHNSWKVTTWNMYCITYSQVYYMETCLKWINFQGSSDSTTCRLCSMIRTSNYIHLPVHLHFHKYHYHAY